MSYMIREKGKKIKDYKKWVSEYVSTNEDLSSDVYSVLRRVQIHNKDQMKSKKAFNKNEELIHRMLYNQSLLKAFENNKVTLISKHGFNRINSISAEFLQKINSQKYEKELLRLKKMINLSDSKKGISNMYIYEKQIEIDFFVNEFWKQIQSVDYINDKLVLYFFIN